MLVKIAWAGPLAGHVDADADAVAAVGGHVDADADAVAAVGGGWWVVVVAVDVLPGVIDVDLDLIVQVCLRCRSEEAPAEDGGRSARHADGEAPGPRQPLHCCAC